jgi:hypothetical protein
VTGGATEHVEVAYVASRARGETLSSTVNKLESRQVSSVCNLKFPHYHGTEYFEKACCGKRLQTDVHWVQESVGSSNKQENGRVHGKTASVSLSTKEKETARQSIVFPKYNQHSDGNKFHSQCIYSSR